MPCILPTFPCDEDPCRLPKISLVIGTSAGHFKPRNEHPVHTETAPEIWSLIWRGAPPLAVAKPLWQLRPWPPASLQTGPRWACAPETCGAAWRPLLPVSATVLSPPSVQPLLLPTLKHAPHHPSTPLSHLGGSNLGPSLCLLHLACCLTVLNRDRHLDLHLNMLH